MQQAMTSHSAALLEAGLRLSRRAPLSRISTAVIATEAGLPSARFFDAYPDLAHFLIDLYRAHFLQPVRALIEAGQARLPPGVERTRAVTTTYLDYSLGHQGLRRWAIEGRSLGDFDAAYASDSRGLQLLARVELQPLGFRDPAAAARLYAAMLYELTTVELADGREHPALRNSLWRLLEPEQRPALEFRLRDVRSEAAPAKTETLRQRLLRAGEELLRSRAGDVSVLRLEDLLQRADCDAPAFEAVFGDLPQFRIALVQFWTEYYMACCVAAAQGLPPGAERIHAFMITAWNCNLNEQRGNRLLMKALLATDEELRARIQARVHSFTRMVAVEFEALGAASPMAMARLFIAASAELVEAEEAEGTAQPALRKAFWQWFDPLLSAWRPVTRRKRRHAEDDTAAQVSFLSMQLGTSRKPRRRLTAPVAAALRQRLVEAGDRLLLSGDGVAELTPERLALLSGVEPNEVEICYPDFNVYLTELLASLLDQARDIAVEATSHHPAGVARLWRGIEVYLDARLDRAAIHELSQQLQGYPAAARLSRGRSNAFVQVIATELRSLGRPDPQETAHLIIALTSETVQAEYEAHRRLPEYRATLQAFLTRSAA